MVNTSSGGAPYRTLVTNGRVRTMADTVKGGVGGRGGFRPHELLEAAVAACMNIGARLKADEMGLGSIEIATEVSLDRSQEGRAIFRCRVRVGGSITGEQRAALEETALACGVGQTLRRECVLALSESGREEGTMAGSRSPRARVPDGAVVAAAPALAPDVRWDAADYRSHASAQTAWGRELHARLALRGDETVLDLGCGDGRLTAELADRVPAGRVYGLDADPDMLAFARGASARHNLAFVEGDLRTFSLSCRADWILSSACLHWIPEHEPVLRRCREHLGPGGRVLFQMGGRGNCAGILAMAAEVAAEPRWSAHLEPFSTPWRFYGPDEYRTWLPACGFRLLRAELFPRDMVHESAEALAGWIRTTWMPILARLPEGRRSEFIAAVVARYLRAYPADAQGRTHVAMVRLEVEAVAVAEGRTT